jgi:hypothetical protein
MEIQFSEEYLSFVNGEKCLENEARQTLYENKEGIFYCLKCYLLCVKV